MIGIYDVEDDSLLERCDKHNLEKALRQWKELGFKTRLGPAFPNLIILE